MDQAWTWGILAAIAMMITAGAVGIAPVAAARDAKSGWRITILSPIPLVIWNILWVIMANPSDGARRPITLVIGGLAGALIMLGVTEMIKKPAVAQGVSPPPNVEQKNENGPNIYAPDNKGIIAPDNKGSIIQHNYINNDPRRWGFTDEGVQAFVRDITPPPTSAPLDIYIRLNDEMAALFYKQIVYLMQNTPGWRVHPQGFVGRTWPDWTGVAIDMPDSKKPPLAAQLLLKAFQSTGLKPPATARDDFSEVRIVISSPPIQ
jgi:hypothetical protein